MGTLHKKKQAMDGKALLTAKLLLIGILFSLGGVSPMSWNFEDELDIGKRSMPQFKLCGNHLINMLGLVCGNFGGQGMAAFLDDPFAYVNSRRRKRAGAVAEWGTSFTSLPSKRSGLADHCCAKAVHFNSSEVFVEHQTEEVE